MVKIVVAQKNGTFADKKVKDFSVDTLYKSCGFKKALSFTKLTTWKVPEKGYYLSVFGRTDGSAGHENKFDFPPPIDTPVFFGNMAIVCTEEKNFESVCDYTCTQWDKDYETLMGGFEDIGDESDETDELDDYDSDEKTKEGYLKDSFIVSDDEASDVESDEEEYDSELEEEEYDYQ